VSLTAPPDEDIMESEAATDRASELSCRRRLLLTPDGPAVGRSSAASGRLLAADGVWTGAAFSGRLLAVGGSLAFSCFGFGVEVVLVPPAAPFFFFWAVPFVSPYIISPTNKLFLITYKSVPSFLLLRASTSI
jgi:hypothetical protein